MKCDFLLLLFLFNFGILCYGKYNGNRIINGTPAAPEKYHNVVRLQAMFLNFTASALHKHKPNETAMNLNVVTGLCTGTLISKRHILTAAHCVVDLFYSELIKDEPGQMKLYEAFFVDYRPVQKFSFSEIKLKNVGFSHGSVYNPRFHYDELHQGDLAILILPANITDIEPVLLAKNYVEGKNDIGINVGYGDMDPSPAQKDAEKLMEVKLPILKDCKQSLELGHICGGNSTHRADHGDSGGPLFFDAADGKQYQIGVAHSLAMKDGGFPTTTQEIPDYLTYMRISDYCGWISALTLGEAECVEIPKKNNPAPPVPKPDPSPINPSKPNNSNETTEITPNKGHTEPQKADENDYAGDDNGAMSKNIFIIILAFFLATVFNV